MLLRPWPAMARTVWGEAARVCEAGWAGSLSAFQAEYFSTPALDEARADAPALCMGNLARVRSMILVISRG